MPKRKNTRAAQGSGTIRERKDGRWEARYTIGRDPGTGKQIQKSIYGDTQKDVLQKLQQVQGDINNGIYMEPSKMTLGQWLDVWLKDYTANIKPATLHAYKGRVEYRIKPAIGALKLSTLKPHMVQSFYNSLQQSEKGKDALSPKSIQNVHGILHKALEQAVELGYMKINPTNACKRPRVEKPEIRPLDSEQIAAFLGAIKDHRFESFYTVDLFLGLRQGELLGLQWSDVDLKTGVIRVSKQLQLLDGEYTFRIVKNDKVRTITPAKFVIDMLKGHYSKQCEDRLRAGAAWNDGDFVFCNEIGEHLSRSTTYHSFKAIIASIGLPETRFHDLRHTYAVASLLAGDDIKTLQENLGHHTAAFTLDTYAHVTEEMKKDSAARMDAFIQRIKSSG